MTDLKSLAREYFNNFNNKDLKKLSNMFSEDIILRDWNIEGKGKQEVLQINKNIFSDVPDISVNILKLYQNDNSVVADLVINLCKKENIFVVDILDFNNSNLITSIRAFKG